MKKRDKEFVFEACKQVKERLHYLQWSVAFDRTNEAQIKEMLKSTKLIKTIVDDIDTILKNYEQD